MDYEGGDLTAVRCCLCWWAGRRVQPVWLQAVGGSLSGLVSLISDEKHIRGVLVWWCAIQIDSLYFYLLVSDFGSRSWGISVTWKQVFPISGWIWRSQICVPKSGKVRLRQDLRFEILKSGRNPVIETVKCSSTRVHHCQHYRHYVHN